MRRDFNPPVHWGHERGRVVGRGDFFYVNDGTSDFLPGHANSTGLAELSLLFRCDRTDRDRTLLCASTLVRCHRFGALARGVALPGQTAGQNHARCVGGHVQPGLGWRVWAATPDTGPSTA